MSGGVEGGALSRAEVSRYSRQLLVPEFADAQGRLRAARVLVVGAGGLGCPVVQYLAGAGVGTLLIADGDTVSVSNLHRQTLYMTADVGRAKAEVAAARAQAVNPFVRAQARPAVTAQNVTALLAEADVVVDATDNFEARYLLADACVAAGRAWVWGAAGGTEGMASVFGPQVGLRDVFPSAAGAESCELIGVVGPLLGVVGGMMALEALKLVAGLPPGLAGVLWTVDALSGRTRQLRLTREKER
ncbi:HesA/MoeB/ThiF family protein [Deinococcus maricopensis]|uniref:UBA/THIF-type NAD/FAD binding protein n=1 Tax=Deinococcus maricopensis (strain DSM 21211 / LMG 22137 / NRRL B-23946 / LB-34) TaxID=709986 RepID=E8U6K7_DEIML|nr:HesA/MoeB/ThiF family protein [Deinococcus maricopensis]ADV66696.1 UBA/THIF-type NAD/FAD binding protein [Deinococcus maricopensis DSM 21211]